MTYGREAPAKMPKVKNELERALAAVRSQESLEIIGKLLYNAATQPKEEKFRSVKLSNDKVKRTIADVPEALALLLTYGWVMEENESEGRILTIPKGKFFSMAEVRLVEDQKNEARKLAQKEQTAMLRARA